MQIFSAVMWLGLAALISFMIVGVILFINRVRPKTDEQIVRAYYAFRVRLDNFTFSSTIFCYQLRKTTGQLIA
jgi:ABC-type transport system involved in multi-copper enzyme maturation permease subunit